MKLKLDIKIDYDVAERDALVTSHMKLARIEAARFPHPNISQDDMEGAAYEGLVIAANKFDSSRGVKFSSYATWWIRQKIFYLKIKMGAPTTPSYRFSELARRAEKATKELIKVLNRTPTDSELAEYLGVSLKKLGSLKNFYREAIPVGEPLRGVRDSVKKRRFNPEDRQTLDGLEALINNQLRGRLMNGLESLPPRQQLILKQCFLLPDGEQRTSEDLGRELGLSGQRVRQLIQEARTHLREGPLKDFL